jgi:hypothetical protein
MDNDKVPHTFAAFRSRHYMATGTTPSEQEIFDAGMRAGRDLQWAKRATEAKPSASAYEQCTHPACGRFKDGASWNCHAMEHNSCARPSASAAPGIDTPEFRMLLATLGHSERRGRGDAAHEMLVAHIDAAIAAAREEVREELEAAHSRALTRTEMEARNAGYAEAEADLRARLAAPEAVAWACWADGKQQKPEYMHLCAYEPKAYPNRRALTWLQPQAKAPQQLEPELRTAQELALAIWRTAYRQEAPQFEVLDTMQGVLSQIDNMVSGMSRTQAPQQPPAGEDAIVAAVHAASATGRIALTVTGPDGIERPTNVATCFVRALARDAK